MCVKLFYEFFTKKSFFKSDIPWMIVAKSFLQSNEPSVSIDGNKLHCCMYRTLPEPKAIRKGKLIYIQKRKGRINHQLQPLGENLI